VSEAPAWIDKRALLLLHKESLAQFGGAGGLRDEGVLDSALARPVDKHSYEGCSDLAALAAAYGFGLARNHPFIDGNKRAAFLAVVCFSQ
jgi:death on curing protein